MATHTIVINWTASTDAVQGYNIYQAENAPGTEKANPPINGAVLVTTNTYTATVPSPGVYEFVVTSLENGAESVVSNEVSAIVLPFPPTDVLVGAIN